MANQISTKQFLITVPEGKRLIAKATSSLEQIKNALQHHTIVIISGTTNAYVAEEILSSIHQLDDFTLYSFYRGITLGHGNKLEPKKEGYANKDIVIEKGIWLKDKTIYDIGPDLVPGDIIIKGANAVDYERKQAGIQIGNPVVGTSAPILQAVIGKRVELIIPVGLEKRVPGNIGHIAAKLNSPSTSGLRMLPIGGTIITELEAIELLSGATTELVAAGGVLGAEGSCWFAVTGTEEQLATITDLLNSIAKEPPFSNE